MQSDIIISQMANVAKGAGWAFKARRGIVDAKIKSYMTRRGGQKY